MLRSPCEIARIEHVPSNLIEVESRCTILVLCGSKSSRLHRHGESSETNVVLYSHRRKQRHWMPIFRDWWLGRVRAEEQDETKKQRRVQPYPMFCWLWHFGCFIAITLHAVCARNHLEMSLYVLSDGRCIPTPPRTVQMHKGLTDTVRVVTEDIGPSEHVHSSGMTRLLRLYAEKEEWLWMEARMLCNAFEDAGQHSNRTLALESEVRDQFLLASAPEPPLPPPPTMTLTPLLVSGPSENRVDLVFFGDGCECLVLKYLPFYHLAFQTPRKKRANSLRMPQGWLTILLLIKPLPLWSHC